MEDLSAEPHDQKYDLRCFVCVCGGGAGGGTQDGTNGRMTR